MNRKWALLIAVILSIIIGFLLMSPSGAMFVFLVWILMSGMFSSFSPDISFALMVIVFFAIAMVVIYLMFRNTRIADPR